MDEFKLAEQGHPETIPFQPRKRGRPKNADRVPRPDVASERPAEKAVSAWLAPAAEDADAAARLEKMGEHFVGRQLKVGVAIDSTTSTEPYDRDMRRGAGGLSGVIAGNPMAKAAVNVALMGFDTECRLWSITRGGFELPAEVPYKCGTFLRPVLDKTAAVTKAFHKCVTENGAVPFEGLTVIISDFQFHDWLEASKLVPAWREYMRRSGQVVVSAMLGQYDRDAAAELSGPVPPVPVDKLNIEALFKLLANTLNSSLGGRGRLETMLKAEFEKLQ